MNINHRLFELNSIVFRHYPSDKKCEIVPLNTLNYFVNLADQVTHICRSEPNYSVMFKDLPFIAERTGQEPKYTRQDAQEWLDHFVAQWQSRGQNIVFLMLEGERLVGAVEVRQQSEYSAELGYWSNPYHKGYMTNALTAFVGELQTIGFTNIYALVKPDNFRSKRLLTWLGMGLCGTQDNMEKYMLTKE